MSKCTVGCLNSKELHNIVVDFVLPSTLREMSSSWQGLGQEAHEACHSCSTFFFLERLWSKREATSGKNITLTALPRLHYYRCLLTRRGVEADPVTNKYARQPPNGPGSCYEQ
ncbi:Beta-hexosaminidase 1 [Vitis vinifera]|uniref:Beta-hexosaminidase 1 n=1 Tax=Vitis vinifera TaxID=29760 RepID=A0A438JXW4_VITVI|nr:Beta-hexosaminidase 1 [Vitis vinifera]RVX13797.1 Beta-hexosaminidase 1 [Vitis vinifera]